MSRETITDIKGTEDVAKIPWPAEQQFFLLLKKKLPTSRIVYQPKLFQMENGDNKIQGTAPDFLIIKPDGTEIFVEITSAQINGKDPKEKQKRVMSAVAPEKKYVVLYRHNLENIQRLHPEISFFGAEKIRNNGNDESSYG